MMTTFEFCVKHQIMRPVCEACVLCLSERAPLQRDTLNILEARISDLSAENLDLRRRVSALEHLVRA